MEGRLAIVQRPSIGEYESLSLGPPGGAVRPPSLYSPAGRGGHRDYESLGRAGEPWRGHSDYEALSYGRPGQVTGLPQPPVVAPKPRLSSVEEDLGPPQPAAGPGHYKRAPPPLPPKPARQPPPLPPHAHHLHSNFGKGPPDPPELPVGVTRTKSGLYLGLPGEKGYNVSFV
jgi:hypothetical protein